MASKIKFDTEDEAHVPSESVKVFQSGDPTFREIRDEKKNPDFKVVRDHLRHIAKLATNERYDVRTRIDLLNTLAAKYRDGTPFKNNKRLNDLRFDGNPVLARQAQAAADQLLSIEKVRYGGDKYDTGKMGNQV